MKRFNSNPREAQNGGNDQPESLPPTPDRLFRVASGMETWTPSEQKWIDDNPRWCERELLLRLAFKMAVHAPAEVAPPH